MPIKYKQQDLQENEFHISYARLIPRAVIMGPIRGAYQGAAKPGNGKENAVIGFRGEHESV